MKAGIDSEAIVLLASADEFRDEGVVDPFTQAAREIGVLLPSSGQEELWLAQTSFSLHRDGISLPGESATARFERNLRVMVHGLQAASPSTEVEAFCQHFGRYFSGNCIDDFEEWLAVLSRLAEKASTESPLCESAASLVVRVAFGAVESHDVEDSERLASTVVNGCH